MQTKLPDGSVMVSGYCGRDPEFKTVGEKNSRKCTVGLVVGKQKNPDDPAATVTIWCNVVAWHDLASLLASARKGDPVFVIGKIKSREYEGKTYTDLEAEFLSVASVHAAIQNPAYSMPAGDTQNEPFVQLSDGDDGELPF